MRCLCEFFAHFLLGREPFFLLIWWSLCILNTKPLLDTWKWSQVKSLSRVQLFVTLWTVARQPPLPWDFPGKNTGVGCHVLLQGIFRTQGSNLGLPHCRQTLYPLSHRASPYWIYTYGKCFLWTQLFTFFFFFTLFSLFSHLFTLFTVVFWWGKLSHFNVIQFINLSLG